jgi:hypothetical protein
VGGATGDVVDIATNGLQGVELAGAGGAGTAINIQRANIHANGQNGLRVALTGTGSSVTAANSGIYQNQHNGVLVVGAPSANATNSLALDNLDIRLHTAVGTGYGRGIWLHGDDADSDDITATINNCKVHDNRDVGIIIDEDGPGGNVTETRASLTGNDVYANNVNTTSTVGGIWFATASQLTAFTANKIHGNGGDQMGFTAPQRVGGNWDLSPGACNASSNSVYCYSSSGVGIRVTNVGTSDYTVDARNVSWAHTTPSSAAGSRDFFEGPDTDILVTTPCTAVTTCP